MSTKPKPSIRLRVLIGSACLLALWIVWDVQHRSTQQPLVAAVDRQPKQSAFALAQQEQIEQASSNRFVLSSRLEEDIPQELVDLFRPHNWMVFKKPVEIEVVAPPKPTAPPVPYTFFGRMRGVDGRVMTYLKRDSDLIVVSVGQTLHNQYKVEAVTPTEVVLTYLPLAERQLVPIGPLGQVDQ